MLSLTVIDGVFDFHGEDDCGGGPDSTVRWK